MAIGWRDTSEPVAVHGLAALADVHGTAAALGALAASRGAALTVVLPRGRFDEVSAFLAAHDVEAGGLLLGRRYAVADGAAAGDGEGDGEGVGEGVGHGEGGAIVGVERFVPGRIAEGTGTSLALGTAIWDDARPWLDGGLAVVGWVHSHPDLGAFFSGTDRRTQRAFFARPWQFGWVVDPVRREQAWFRGGEAAADGLRVVAA